MNAKRFTVYTVASGIGNKVRNPHRVHDAVTGETVDEYASKRAAQSDARERNAAAAATVVETEDDKTARLATGVDDDSRATLAELEATVDALDALSDSERAAVAEIAPVMLDALIESDNADAAAIARAESNRRAAQTADPKVVATYVRQGYSEQTARRFALRERLAAANRPTELARRLALVDTGSAGVAVLVAFLVIFGLFFAMIVSLAHSAGL